MSVNIVLGLLVALVAAFMLARYSPLSILLATVGATIAFLVIQLMVPVIDHHAAFKLPDIMVESFWHQFGLLAAGLFIIISVFYVVKRAFMGTRVVH